MKRITLALAMVALFSGLALAESSMQELRQRFEQRYPQIRALKDKGLIGETPSGYLDVVANADAEQRKLMDEDNNDRRELYQLIAKKENTTPDLVAKRNAQRNYERAKSGDYLKGDDGQWHKK